MNGKQLPALRQELRQQLSELDKLLESAFERSPISPGYFQEYGRRCGRPHCRCVEGEFVASKIGTKCSGLFVASKIGTKCSGLSIVYQDLRQIKTLTRRLKSAAEVFQFINVYSMLLNRIIFWNSMKELYNETTYF